MYAPLRASSLAALTGVVFASAAIAQSPPPPPTAVAGEMRAFVTVPAKGGAKLSVTSGAFPPGGDIPFHYTQYEGNNFPGLTWTAGPAGTQTYVVIMEDVDGRNRTTGAPFLHWTMANIPARVTKLDEAMMAPPAGASNGPNMRGANQPYMGPRTPAGPKHRYHFQVFALDTTLPAEALATYAALTAAMKDHVLASGEVIGLGQVKPPAPR
jgi:para-nitrobenzyl esterase